MLSFCTVNRSTGYAVQGKGEADCFQCCHCGHVFFIKSTDGFQEVHQGGVCIKCMAPVCGPCAGKPCLVFEQRLEIYEQSQRFARDAGLVLR